MDYSTFFLSLLKAVRIFGELAVRMRIPPVMGEMLAGAGGFVWMWWVGE